MGLAIVLRNINTGFNNKGKQLQVTKKNQNIND
jgi:hypothetical protein